VLVTTFADSYISAFTLIPFLVGCVIMLVKKDRPSHDMLDEAWARNPDGGGIAWREKGVVRWKKGLPLDDMHRLCETTPLPYVAHFRVGSSGGVRPSLCHPFPISETVPLDLEGSTEGSVLFHNGDFREWRAYGLRAAEAFKVQIPADKWSDTRAIAWLCSMYGIQFMEWMDFKGITFSPQDIEVFWGTGWKKINEVWCSNDYFITEKYTPLIQQTGHYICVFGRCMNKINLDANGYCPEHTKIHTAPPSTPLLGTVSNPHVTIPADTGGDQPADPFQVVMLAEQKHQAGLLSKNQLKKIRKHYLGTTVNLVGSH